MWTTSPTGATSPVVTQTPGWVTLSGSGGLHRPTMRPAGVVRHWTDLAGAAVRAATAADPAACVSTQGHVLTVADFLATLVAEAVIHHLDAVVSLPDAPEPKPEATAIATSTVEGLFGP